VRLTLRVCRWQAARPDNRYDTLVRCLLVVSWFFLPTRKQCGESTLGELAYDLIHKVRHGIGYRWFWQRFPCRLCELHQAFPVVRRIEHNGQSSDDWIFVVRSKPDNEIRPFVDIDATRHLMGVALSLNVTYQ